MERIYHRYEKREETHSAMWHKVAGEDRERLLKEAIEFTGDAERYGSYMMRVIREWPISCEHNMSKQEMNKQAWVGHAASCIALNCPEEVTREAWHYLTKEQQDEANKMADKAIEEWGNMMEAKCQKHQLVPMF